MAREREKNRKIGFVLGCLILGVVIFTGISGCSDTPQPKPKAKKLRIGLMITPKGLNDKGFNDLAYSGLKSAASRYGVETVIIEPSTMKDPETSLRFFAEQTFDSIIAVGVAFSGAIKNISKEHPQLKFFVIDSSIEEGNIRGVSFREDEGSYLCGFLAGTLSKSHKVGFVGGVRNEVILRFYEGFRNGVQSVGSDVVVIEKYIAEDFSGFNRAELGKEIALDLYKNGCDVIYHAAGASGLGVISAAVEAKKFVIGVDMDQDSLAPGLVLTSMLKKVDRVVEDLVKNLVEGKDAGDVKRSYGINDGAIDLTDFQFSNQIVGLDTIKKIGELKKGIAEGKLITRVASSTQ